jgi:hypothetical protein
VTRRELQKTRSNQQTEKQNVVAKTDDLGYNPFNKSNFQFPTFNFQSLFFSGEVMELVPVPDFKSGGSWPWSGMVRSIRMLSRHI